MAVTPNVIQRHYSDLLRVFSTSQDTLFVITGGFYQAELIDRDTKNTIFTTTPLLASSRILLDHIEMKVDQSTDNVSSVLEVLEEQVALKEIVQKMKQFLTKVELKQKEVGKQVHINNTTVSKVTSQSGVPPAFLPQSCGCGSCTIKGWRTEQVCQNVYMETRPDLLIVNPDHPIASEFITFERDYDRQARLCSETSKVVNLFAFLSLKTWKYLKLVVEEKKYKVSDITFELSAWLNHPLPVMSNLHELQAQLHLLRVSWFNFGILFFLFDQLLSTSYPDLQSDWKNYFDVFGEYCSGRNLRDYVNVFFQVEEQNVFLLEVDKCLNSFTVSDIRALQNSLSIALGCPSVCLHLVTVREGSLIIYLYYSYSDYLTVFQSVSTEQLKMISQIKAYRILSLTDIHNQFRYDNIQSYAEDIFPSSAKTSTVSKTVMKKGDNGSSLEVEKGENGFSLEVKKGGDGSSLKDTYEEMRKVHLNVHVQEEIELWKKQSQMKDIDLSRTREELSVTITDIKRKEDLIVSLSEDVQKLKRQITAKEEELAKSLKMKEEESRLKDVEFSKKEVEMVRVLKKREEENEVWRKSQQRVLQKFQKISPIEYVKEMSSKPVKTITGLKSPYGTAVCDNGDIVVTEWSAHCVTIVNKEGKKVRSFGTEGTKEGQFTYPRGVAITNDENILVTDEHRLQKLTFDGVCVQSVGSSITGSDQLQFDYPRGIAVHPTTGLVFVADSNNSRIQVFNSDLTYAHSINLHGDKLKSPYDVLLDSDGCVYVAEWGNHCITKLTTTGEFITRFGSKGSAPGQLYFPSSLTINDNLVYVSEFGNDRVSVFDTKGTFLHCFGKRGSGEGEFYSPRGITKDIFSNLYVSDFDNNRLVVY